MVRVRVKVRVRVRLKVRVRIKLRVSATNQEIPVGVSRITNVLNDSLTLNPRCALVS